MDAKTAADTVFVGKQRTFNRRFLQMYGHYLIETEGLHAGRGLGLCQRGATDGVDGSLHW